MKPGVYLCMPRHEYDAIEAVNWSTLKHILRSPGHYQQSLLPREGPVPEAFRIGEAVHTRILEPARYKRDYIQEPSVWRSEKTEVRGDRKSGYHVVHLDGRVPDQTGFRTKTEAKDDALAWRVEGIEDEGFRTKADAQQARAQFYAGKHFLRPADVELADGCHKAVHDSAAGEAVVWALDSRMTEVTCVWLDDTTQILCKCRIDLVAMMRGDLTVLDLKTCQDSRPQAFARDCWKFGYHRQLAYYTEGYCAALRQSGETQPERIFAGIVAVEKTKPHAVHDYMLGHRAWDAGDSDWQEALQKLAYCRQTDDWSAPKQEQAHIINPPKWA